MENTLKEMIQICHTLLNNLSAVLPKYKESVKIIEESDYMEWQFEESKDNEDMLYSHIEALGRIMEKLNESILSGSLEEQLELFDTLNDYVLFALSSLK